MLSWFCAHMNEELIMVRPLKYSEPKSCFNLTITPTAKKWLKAQKKAMGVSSSSNVVEQLARRPEHPQISALRWTAQADGSHYALPTYAAELIVVVTGERWRIDRLKDAEPLMMGEGMGSLDAQLEYLRSHHLAAQ